MAAGRRGGRVAVLFLHCFLGGDDVGQSVHRGTDFPRTMLIMGTRLSSFQWLFEVQID